MRRETGFALCADRIPGVKVKSESSISACGKWLSNMCWEHSSIIFRSSSSDLVVIPSRPDLSGRWTLCAEAS